MKKKTLSSVSLSAILFLIFYPLAQAGNSFNSYQIRPILGFEYLTRMINPDQGESNSKLKAYLIHLGAELEIEEGFRLGVLIGYSFSNFDAMTFRNLPFSVELDVGKIGGYLAGAELTKKIFKFKEIEIAAWGQFVSYLGKKEEWQIPGLAVEGSVEGKPFWMRILVGPQIEYKALESLTPSLGIYYNKLWGKFKLEEKVQELEGKEEKKISGKGILDFRPGLFYRITGKIGFKAEASLIPREKGIDPGFLMRFIYSF